MGLITGSRLVIPCCFPSCNHKAKKYTRTEKQKLAAATEVREIGRDVGIQWRTRYDEQIFRLAVPSLCANLLIPISTSVDAAIAGQLGAAHLSGVGLGAVTYGLFMSLVTFIPILITPKIAQRNARNEDVSIDIAHSLWFTLSIGIVAGAAIFVSVEPIMSLLKPAIEIRSFAQAYIRTMAVMAPASAVLFWISGVYRGLNDSGSILKASVLGVIINVILDLLSVNVFGWSVAGIAFATVVSTYGATAFLFYRLIARKKLRIPDLAKVPDFRSFLPMLRDGLRLSTRSLLVMATMTSASMFIAKRGVILHGAYEICRQAGLLTYVLSAAIEQTVQSLSAACIGREDYASAQIIISRCIQLSVGLSLVSASLVCMFAGTVAGFYTTDPTVIAAFVSAAPVFLSTTPLSAFVSVVDGALIGASRSTIVATTQSIGALLGLSALFLMQQTGTLTLMGALVAVRFAVSMHGIVTTNHLFFTKTNPYGFVGPTS